MSMKLRDLIRKVRACKTAAEERAVIAKESAMIRTAIREEQEHYRHRNVAKLLFMHMLGYPTHFGQLECMKLIASPHFPEKRIGYLGMMLLLSEEADVLMLATNSLKNDLNSDNRFVAGLALCTIGNLATSDMSRDLVPEVDKHLKSSQPYLRKKACLALTRCLVKCPDMVEDFVDRVVTLLKDRSHGVLITVVQLMTQVLVIDQENADEEGYDNPTETPCRNAFAKLVPALVKLLRNLISMGYSPDHDVGGISDPFLQVQILTLLRLLGTGDEKASEEMNDVLAQVATNTETSKNPGNAILYECVQTIMAVESEDGLRVLAVNILGRFLLNRDNNIRYVALNTLSRLLKQEEQDTAADDDEENANTAASALQRHRSTVVDCLKDPDISIRQRALELIYHLVNSENVQALTAELLNYLVLCPREHRADICARILRVVERYSPDDRWRVDTLITMLTIAGRETAREVQSAIIVYISRSEEDLRAYSTHKLMTAIRDDDGSQRGLLTVGIWCIGEYGDLVLSPYSYTPSPSENGSSDPISFMALAPSQVVNTVESVTTRHSCTEMVKQTALTAFTKLSNRFADKGDPVTLERLHSLVKKYQSDHSLELQLRSCEYDALLNAVKGIRIAPLAASNEEDIFGVTDSGGGVVSAAVKSAAKEALARMPVVDLKVMQRKQAHESFGESDILGESSGSSPPKVSKSGAHRDPFGMEDIFGGAPAPAASDIAEEQQQNRGEPAQKEASDVDLLADIFSARPAAAPAAPATDAFAAAPAAGGLADPFAAAPAPVNPMDLFGRSPAPAATQQSNVDPFGAPAITQPMSAPAPATQPQGPIRVPGFSHGGLTVEFECSKPDTWNQQKTELTARFKNTTNDALYGLSLQVAVPRFCTMKLEPPSSTTVPVTVGENVKVTQTISVENSQLGTKNLMLKVKVGFTSQGTKIDHMATCNQFPAGQY
mmetsp:Transcript_4331/g.6184  ORF Transcript_4331/g.6184 Transcript_4331/m.6184 type:complete len:951 (+) Transcript_4331:152-3004(+)